MKEFVEVKIRIKGSVEQKVEMRERAWKEPRRKDPGQGVTLMMIIRGAVRLHAE